MSTTLDDMKDQKLTEDMVFDREQRLKPPTVLRISGPLQNTYVRLLGMPRSGTHAVMNWLAYRLGKTGCYIEEKQKCDYEIPPSGSSDLPAFSNGVDAVSSDHPKDFLIHGFEWRPCNSVFNPHLEHLFRPGMGGFKRKLNVLVLRDPYNLAASMRNKRTDNAWRPLNAQRKAMSMLRMWTDHAVWFLEHKDDPDCLCINYNEWFVSEEYRQSICEKADVDYDERGLDDVSSYAAGSSFDGTTKRGREMAVLDRWQTQLNDDLYLWMFARWPEVREMSRLVFGEHPAEEVLFANSG